MMVYESRIIAAGGLQVEIEEELLRAREEAQDLREKAEAQRGELER
jgi:hypothetical protein